MNPIRPSQMQPVARPPESAQDAAKLAAQRAFFAAAMGQGSAVQKTAASAAAVAAPEPARAQRTPDASAPSPQKILRPGSLLDIRI